MPQFQSFEPKSKQSNVRDLNISYPGSLSSPAVPVLTKQAENVAKPPAKTNPEVSDESETLKLKDSVQTETLEKPEDEGLTEKKPFQLKGNNTGLPDGLKSGIETLSGFSMNDVKVHYNSDRPAQLYAFAYAQGANIHIAPGQEKHLPHEAWHVVQQKQGRVKPTLQMKGEVSINNDKELESEADRMGIKALQLQNKNSSNNYNAKGFQLDFQVPVIQRSLIAESNRVAKGPRNNFRNDLQQLLGITSGQARCHTVPFGYIRGIVMNQINSGLAGSKGPDDVRTDLLDIVNSVFPNGGTAKNHDQHTNSTQLNSLARELHTNALTSLSNIRAELNTNPKNINNLASYGTTFIDLLNNSPDNLRPGDSSTNSSISDALDIPNTKIVRKTLQPGTIIVDGSYKPKEQLSAAKEVFAPDVEMSTIILDLLDSAPIGFVIRAYSSAYEIQSSDSVKMKTGNMTNQNPIPIAIELKTGWYLFETS